LLVPNLRCLRNEKSPALPLAGPPAGARAGKQVYLDADPRLTEQRIKRFLEPFIALNR